MWCPGNLARTTWAVACFVLSTFPTFASDFFLEWFRFRNPLSKPKKRHEPLQVGRVHFLGEDPWSLRSDVYAFWAQVPVFVPESYAKKTMRGEAEEEDLFKYFTTKVGPVPAIRRVITLLIRVITPATDWFSTIYRGPTSLHPSNDS